MTKNLINKSIHEYSDGQEWTDFVRSLAIRSATAKNSKTIPEITIIFGPRTLVRFNRDSKTLTHSEMLLLCDEYEMSMVDLRELLWKRKIKILDAEGNEIVKPKRTRTKKDADSPPRRRKNRSRDQLIESRPDPNMPSEKLLQPITEP